MTEQSTPTPTEELTAILRGARTMGVTGEMDVTFQDAGAALRAAGWKSPAEVAELVRVGAEEAFRKGVIAGANELDDDFRQRLRVRHAINPYSKPTPETVPSDV